MIDCPPSLGLLTLNGLVAADTVLIPLHCEYFALEGLADLVGTMRRVRAAYNPTLDIEGVLLTMYDERTNLGQQVARDVREFFKEKVFRTVIPRNVRLGEAPSHGVPGVVYDARSRGAEAYLALAHEVIDAPLRPDRRLTHRRPRMEKRPALGKGLSALIPDAPVAAARRASPVELDVDQLEPSEFQPRLHIDDARLDEPGGVDPRQRRHPAGRGAAHRHRSLPDHRRRAPLARRAARRADPRAGGRARTSPAGREGQLLEWALIENLQREDLNPIEEAHGVSAAGRTSST